MKLGIGRPTRAFVTGGEQLPAIAEKLPGLRLKAGAIADRALAALDGRR